MKTVVTALSAIKANEFTWVGLSLLIQFHKRLTFSTRTWFPFGGELPHLFSKKKNSRRKKPLTTGYDLVNYLSDARKFRMKFHADDFYINTIKWLRIIINTEKYWLCNGEGILWECVHFIVLRDEKVSLRHVYHGAESIEKEQEKRSIIP